MQTVKMNKKNNRGLLKNQKALMEIAYHKCLLLPFGRQRILTYFNNLLKNMRRFLCVLYIATRGYRSSASISGKRLI